MILQLLVRIIGTGNMRHDAEDRKRSHTDNGTVGGKGAGGPAAKEDPKLIFGITKRTCDFMETQAKAGHLLPRRQ